MKYLYGFYSCSRKASRALYCSGVSLEEAANRADCLSVRWIAQGDYCRWCADGSNTVYICDTNGNVVSTEYVPD